MISNSKIIRFKNKNSSEADFDLIDSYRADIGKYIFTDIKMTDWKSNIEEAFQSRLQILLSSVLLRSLLLKEAIVQHLNENNFPAYYSSLKSFLEIPALLGYIAHIIYSSKGLKEIIPKINELSLGNREAGDFFVGDIKSINILTLFDKADTFFKEKDENPKPLRTFYEDVCNFGHINFNAHIAVGKLRKGDIWKAETDFSKYKELYPFYMPGFTTAITAIKFFCSLIAKNKKVENFSLLKSKHYEVHN